MSDFVNLFGDDFSISLEPKNSVKSLLNKIKSAGEEDLTAVDETAVIKALKSDKLSIEDQLAIIKDRVLKVLGRQQDNIITITNNTDFTNYISDAIKSGYIAVDTETNNSLDPVTCKLMGLCLYYPGGKAAYIPTNHRDPITKERLETQCTEADCNIQLQRVIDAKIPIIMHNGKFDYEVLKCTCNSCVVPTWDTMVAARLLDENEKASLKIQYITKIDPEQEKYDIDALFKNIAYADVDPDIFALYAAQDAFMTYKLYQLQKVEFDKPEYGPHLDISGKHEVKGLRWLFHEVEMPIVLVTAEMELAGVCVDRAFGDRLKVKYEHLLSEIDNDINNTLNSLSSLISVWRISPEANAKTKTYVPKKTKMTQDKIIKTYPEVEPDGTRFKYGKAKAEQLSDPINLASPAQLAILFYDLLKVPTKPDQRATGKDELKAIKETLTAYLPKLELLEEAADLDEEELVAETEEAIEKSKDQDEIFRLGTAARLADKILKRRTIAKLVTTYIDVIPDLAKHWPDGRIRFHLNSLGTSTGRYSSGGTIKYMEDYGLPTEHEVEVPGINIQNIPAKGDGKITRMLFRAPIVDHVVDCQDNYYCVPETDEVETIDGWKMVDAVKVGDTIIGDDNVDVISNITKVDRNYYLYIA